MTWEIQSDQYYKRLNSSLKYQSAGKVTKSLGILYEAHLPGASVGSLCEIRENSLRDSGVEAEVIGFRDNRVILMPFAELQGINKDSHVLLKQNYSAVKVSPELLGRVIDGRGAPIDGLGDFEFSPRETEERPLYQKPEDPMKRPMISEPLDLGVRSINGLLSCGKGQRVGIMAGSGVGKSVLLGMMAKNTSADVNVIALIGERGREVREFIERDLGPEGLKKSIVIVATSDSPPLVRKRASFLAATISEYFRDQGKDVLLLMDSVTRFCMAQREIGLSLGEPPASKGYTPSVFSLLPKLLERAGTSQSGGSITGLYTVLVEGDDMDEPIADSARSILDGHIVLTRKLAEKGHFPAVAVLESASRVMRSVVTEEHQQFADQIKEWMALYYQTEDLINIGAYVKGSNAKIDQAISVIDRIHAFLRQGINDQTSFEDTQALMQSIIRSGEAFVADGQSQV